MKNSLWFKCCLLIFSALLVLTVCSGGCSRPSDREAASSDPSGNMTPSSAQYVGRQACADCHKAQFALFQGSDHDLAMDLATPDSVLGDFNNAVFDHLGISSRFFKQGDRFFVHTEGPQGEFQDFEIKYVFGVRPLQQYLIEFPGGAYQCLPLCWDSRSPAEGGGRWFHIYDQERIAPDDILFWTRITQTWNYMCAECHSTNLRKGFDRITQEYTTQWSEIDVSCEACHGPGSEHVRWAEAADRGRQIETAGYLGLALRLKEADGGTWVFRDLDKGTAERSLPRRAQTVVETCARCHARRTSIHAEYRHGRSFMDSHWPSLLEEQLYFPDGQIQDEVYVYGSFLQSKMYNAGVSCRDCHEPHSGRVFAQGNALCFRCHSVEKFGGASHHFHKDDSTGSLCVECHMRERTYMVVDPRRDHSMRIPRPDLSDRLETPNACILCHDHKDKSNLWAAEFTQKWYGDLQDGRTHYGEIFFAARRGYPEARAGLLDLAQNVQNPPMIRATAFLLLIQYPYPETLEAFKKAVYDNDPLIRMTAVQAFEIMDADERFSYIKHLLRDPVRLVRIRAAFLLAGITRDVLSPSDRKALENVIQEYRQVQYFNADHPTAHLNLGVLATLEGDPLIAEAEYRKAIRIEPRLPFTYINLADLYRSQSREADGEKVLRLALDLNPEVADIHHALGLLYVRQNKITPALSALNKAAELAPENARFSYVYGVALNSQDRSEEALSILEKALEQHPFDRDLLYALATINRDLSRFARALEYTTRLVKMFPEVPAFQQLEQLLRSRIQ